MPKNVVCKKCNNLVNDWCEKVIKYTCGAGTPEEAETNCTYFIRGECTSSFCEYRRKKRTNADRIRSMSDDELNELFNDIYNAGAEDAVAYEWGQRTNSFEWTMEWLKQSAEEDNKNG